MPGRCRAAVHRHGGGTGTYRIVRGGTRAAVGRPEARRMGVGAADRAEGPGAGVRGPVETAGDRVPERRAHRCRDRFKRQAWIPDTDRRVHHPAEGRQTPLEQIPRRADALPAAPDVGWRGAACRRAARLPRKPRLRAPADGICKAAVHGDTARHHGHRGGRCGPPGGEGRRRSAGALLAGHGRQRRFLDAREVARRARDDRAVARRPGRGRAAQWRADRPLRRDTAARRRRHARADACRRHRRRAAVDLCRRGRP